MKLFSDLSTVVEKDLRATNPWWDGLPQKPVAPFRRWAFDPLYSRLQGGLAPAVVLRGPRQVGKTTLLEQLIEELLRQGVEPRHILRVQFDELPSLLEIQEPILEIARWFSENIIKATFNELAREKKVAYIFFDEVQNLPDWAPQLKHLVDLNQVRVMVTGSSALRIEHGRDSLAGRLTTLEMGPLLLREISALRGGAQLTPLLKANGLGPLREKDFWQTLKAYGESNRSTRDEAFSAFAQRGGYPIAQVRRDRTWEEIADQLNETVIQRAIQHDLRFGERGRKRDQTLLEEVFRMCCRYAGQAPGPSLYTEEIKKALTANISWQRILTYLRFLDGTLLIKLIQPMELRLKKKKGSYKICLGDHALRASWLQEIIPLDRDELGQSPHTADLAGHLAESIAGYFLSTLPGLDIAHFPARAAEPEVDFVLTIGDRRIPIEIKYRRQIDDWNDTIGLRKFIEKSVYNAPFGLLITLDDGASLSDPRIINMPLSTLLLLR